MEVSVIDLHTDRSKVYIGSDFNVSQKIISDYPWLYSPNSIHSSIMDILEHLGTTGGYFVDIDSETEKRFDGLSKSEDNGIQTKHVALVLVMNGIGSILLGKRNDNNKWTLPAGHLNPGESPEDGARRELLEETGLTPKSLTYLKTQSMDSPERENPEGTPGLDTPNSPSRDKIVLHCFSALCQGEPTGKNDPDQECDKWQWVDARGGLPGNIYDKLHGPDGDANVVRQLFDLKRSEVEWLDAGFADLSKGYAQRAARFNPDTMDPEDEADIAHWLGPDREGPETRENVPYMGGAERTRAIMRLTAATATRRGPNGEVQFLLHRGVSPEEHAAVTNVIHNAPGKITHEDVSSSWTPRYNVAHNWAKDYSGYDSRNRPVHVLSAWISENSIHSIPKQYGEVNLSREHEDYPNKVRGPNQYSSEHEVIVNPHQSDMATPEEVQLQSGKQRDLDRIIQARGSKGKRFEGIAARSASEQYKAGQLRPDSPHIERARTRFAGAPNQLPLPGIKKSIPTQRWAYHITTLDALNNIREKGLLPNYEGVWSGRLWHSDNPHDYPVIDPKRDVQIRYPWPSDSKIHESEIPTPTKEYYSSSPVHSSNIQVNIGKTWGTLPKRHPSGLRNGWLDSQWNRLIDIKKSDASQDDSAEKKYSGISQLLKHPDPRERALALKLSGATPANIAIAILDPDGWVWRQAFHHPNAQHALDILASSTRDAAGVPIWDRHQKLIDDPRRTPNHINMMHRAILSDSHLPEADRAERLYALGMNSHDDLYKSEWAHHTIAENSHPTKYAPADYKKETSLPHLGHLVEAYHQYVNHPTVGHGLKPENADLHDTGWLSPKAIYKMPVSGYTEPQRLMVKPYSEKQHPQSGWAELTNQALYHAGGIGHLHQKVFMALHGETPATVTHIENAEPIYNIPHEDIVKRNPEAANDARRIAIMDFLTTNDDRSAPNLMIRPDGQLIAIDHAGAFDTQTNTGGNAESKFKWYAASSALNLVAPHDRPGYENALKWWKQASPAIRQEFKNRSSILLNKNIASKIKNKFNARADWLDQRAKEVDAGALEPNWMEI